MSWLGLIRERERVIDCHSILTAHSDDFYSTLSIPVMKTNMGIYY